MLGHYNQEPQWTGGQNLRLSRAAQDRRGKRRDRDGAL